MTAPDLARLTAELAARDGHDYLANWTIRRIFAPVSALFAQAVEDGLIPHNPARDVRLPSGDDDDQDDEDPTPSKARALTREELDRFLLVVDPRWRVFFETLTVTGLRISEAIGLEWRHVQLDGSSLDSPGAPADCPREGRAAEELSRSPQRPSSPFPRRGA